MSQLPHLVVVPGPTGSGKSDLALSIAEQFEGEIVNCDSVQLYRYLNIGTAKTPPGQRRGIPHHLIDILDPDQTFTAGDYARLARQTVSEIASRGKLPVVVGGTGFYIRALLEGLSDAPPRDTELRERLARRSPSSLHRILRRLDPPRAERIHPNDANKLTRAIELCAQVRKPATDLFKTNPSRPLENFRVHRVGLDPDRDALAERINLRCIRMFESGLVQEAAGILKAGFSPDSKALQSIGYHEAVRHLTGELSLDEALERTQAATRQYAKRQRTWFRRDKDIFWIPDFGDRTEAQAAALHHLAVVLNKPSFTTKSRNPAAPVT